MGKLLLDFNFNIIKNNILLFNFVFKELSENNYIIKYKLDFESVDSYLTGDLGLVAKGYIARTLSGFMKTFNLVPYHEHLGFDPELDVSFECKFNNEDLLIYLDRFKAIMIDLLNEQEVILTRENINKIISYYEDKGLENTNEHFIVLDGDTNELIEFNKDIVSQKENKLALWLEKEDIDKINSLSKPILIHNHKESMLFSENDKKTYEKIKEVVTSKFYFMIYVESDKTLIDYKTMTAFS